MSELSVLTASWLINLAIEYLSGILVRKQQSIYKSDNGEKNLLVSVLFVLGSGNTILHDYKGRGSSRLRSVRVAWRKESALCNGHDKGVNVILLCMNFQLFLTFAIFLKIQIYELQISCPPQPEINFLKVREGKIWEVLVFTTKLAYSIINGVVLMVVVFATLEKF